VPPNSDMWVSVTETCPVLRLRIEELPPIWRLVTNILNKQPRAADKFGLTGRGLGELLTTPYLITYTVTKHSHFKTRTWTDMFVLGMLETSIGQCGRTLLVQQTERLLVSDAGSSGPSVLNFFVNFFRRAVGYRDS
jgi:hypothetical protein